jgi:hypothetical protein
MLVALLVTILPTLLAAILLPKIGFTFKSNYLKVACSWFAGLYLFTFLTFFLSCFFNNFTTHVLLRATFTSLIVIEASFFFVWKDAKQLLKSISQTISFKFINIFLIAFCLLFAYGLISPNLQTHNDTIYTSVIYWDFHWHAAIIQDFAFGDNFPPQNEAFPGIPMAYHFFGDMVMATYEVTGLSLTSSITFTSILFFFFALITIIGVSEEFFTSKFLGFLAVCFMIFSSSGHVIYYIIQNQGESVWQLITEALTNSDLPFNTSFIWGNPFHYAGTMFNLFYFLEERHMLIAPVFLLLSIWVIVNRNNFSLRTLIVLGALMGGFFYWNVFVALMIPLGLLCVLLFDSNRRTTLALFIGCIVILGVQYESLKHAITFSDAYSPGLDTYPKFNLHFITLIDNYSPASYLKDFIEYYFFGYGIKIILAPIGFFMIWKRQKHLALILLAFTIPTFILINTMQISPSGVGENHKLILNMNVLLDLATAYAIYRLLSKNFLYKLLAVVCFFLLIASGIIEDAPFFNVHPTSLYADYSPSSMSRIIQNNTFPQATIVGRDSKEIQLAGRKIFVGASAGSSVSIDMTPREQLFSKIYKQRTVQKLCTIIDKNPIDYVELEPTDLLYSLALQKNVPYFTAYNSRGTQMVFLDTQKLCRTNSSTMLQ